jgi:hypothetical protein
MIAILLAQVPHEIPGAAGWVGATLLSGVLYWLLFHHLPAKDKQLTEIMAIKDKQIFDTIKSKDEHIERISARFEAVMNKVLEHCDQEIEAIRSYYQRVYSAPAPTPAHGVPKLKEKGE